MVNWKKRFLAYLLDMILLMLILYVFSLFMGNDNNVIKVENAIGELNSLFAKKSISAGSYFHDYALLIHRLDIANAFYSIMNAIFIIIYFAFIPYYKNGQTYGQKIMKIKIVSDKKTLPTIKSLFIRNIFINGLGYMLISLSLLYIIPTISYFFVTSFLGFGQLFIVIKSSYMIIYKENKQGIQDIISHTYVIEDIEV